MDTILAIYNQYGYLENIMITLREMRDSSHMTQKEFAKRFGIPLATYRKWEQGEVSPAPYVVKLIAASMPALNDSYQRIEGVDNKQYYYNKSIGMIFDDYGNSIHITVDLDEVKKENLKIYLERLFSDFTEIVEKFERDCQFDKKENIIWMKK